MRRVFCLALLALGVALGSSVDALPATPVAEPGTVEIAGVVTGDDDRRALAGSTVEAAAFGLQTLTDSTGRYRLSLPPAAAGQNVRLRFSHPEYEATDRTLLVPSGGEPQVVLDVALATGFAEVITVGSRAAGAAGEQAVPVDVFSAAALATTGASELGQILEAVAPSFNFPRTTVTDGTDTVRPATLRGLGPDQVLVLVNGKRRHTSALVHVNGSIGRGSTGVDLNAVPATAIERVEILRDGAAAQYGSDAIAGVINLVLKQSPAPTEVSLRAGATTHGDGELGVLGLSKGFTLPGGGSLALAIELRDRGATNRAGDDPRPSAPAAQPSHQWGDAEARDVMAFVNAAGQIGPSDQISWYSFGGLSRRDGSHGGFYRLRDDARNFPSIYPEGFLPLIEPVVLDSSLSYGMRGTAADWFWDVSLGWGRNEFEFHLANTLNVSLGPAVPPNQTTFDAGALGFDQLVLNADASRALDLGWAGPLNLAFGIETRREGYDITAGEPASYLDGGSPNQFGGRAAPGAQVFPGFRPSDEINVHRDSWAVYLDLEANVLAALRVGLAGRYEDFSDFGSTTDVKLSLRAEPLPGNENLALRAAAATGSRAPSLGQSYFSAVSTNFLNVGGVLQPFEVGTFPVASSVARALGASPLEPETSTHVSAGVVWSPTPTLELTADGYRIDIDDRVVFSENFTGSRVAALLAPFGVAGARFFTNAIDTRTEGYDLHAVYQPTLSNDWRLRFDLAYNFGRTAVTAVRPTPTALAGLDEAWFGTTERLRVTCGQPRDNLRLAADLDRHLWFAAARASRYGEYCLVDRRVTMQTLSPEWLVDLELGYHFSQLTAAVGVQNLGDNFPDRNLPENSNLGIFPYSSQSPFGMNGRFVYGRVSYRF